MTQPPELPAWLTDPRGRHAQASRRRPPRAALAAASRGIRGRTTSTVSGSIDWFASLLRGSSRRRASARSRLRASDLCYRMRRAQPKQLWIVALDCSSSMLRGGALAAAKGVAHALQACAVRSGAHVALISFRGPSARTEVTSSPGRAILAQTIRELGGGGGTPLREALDEAFALSQRRSWRPASIAKQLVLLTDGRTREAVDAQLAVPEGLALTVVDCERTSLRLSRSRGLADALRARYLHVDEL